MVNGAPVTVGGATIPLPYALLDRVPLLQFGRTAGRYMPLASVGLAVLAAHGLAALGEGLAGRGQRNALAAAAALLITVEYVIPYSAMHGGQRATIPQAVEALATLPNATAVLTVPVGTARREAMYYQTAHGLPLAAGRIDRDIDPVPGLLPLARQALTPDINRLPAADRETIHAMLAHYGIDTVVLLRDMPLPAELDETEQLLAEVFGAPVLADARTAIYRVDGTTTASGRIVTIVDRFGQMGARRRGEEGTLAGDGMLYIYGPACARATVTLNLSPATRTLDVIVTADGARQVFPVTERTDVAFEIPLSEGIAPVELSVYRRGRTTNRTAVLHALAVTCADE